MRPVVHYTSVRSDNDLFLKSNLNCKLSSGSLVCEPTAGRDRLPLIKRKKGLSYESAAFELRLSFMIGPLNFGQKLF